MLINSKLRRKLARTARRGRRARRARAGARGPPTQLGGLRDSFVRIALRLAVVFRPAALRVRTTLMLVRFLEFVAEARGAELSSEVVIPLRVSLHHKKRSHQPKSFCAVRIICVILVTFKKI